MYYMAFGYFIVSMRTLMPDLSLIILDLLTALFYHIISPLARKHNLDFQCQNARQQEISGKCQIVVHQLLYRVESRMMMMS